MSNKKKVDILMNEAKALKSMLTIESRIKYALHELLEKVKVRSPDSYMDPDQIEEKIKEVGKRYDELDGLLDNKMSEINALLGRQTGYMDI